MRRTSQNITLIIACLFFLLSGVSGGLAAVDGDADALTPPVITGQQLMQEKINYLMTTLQERLAQLPESERPALFVGEDFTTVSGLEQLQKDVLDPNHPLHDAVQKAGRLHQDAQTRPALADDANLYLNLAILDALDELLKNPSLTDEVKNTVYALIDLLKELELPEAYQVPDTRFGFTGFGRPDDRDRTDRSSDEDVSLYSVPGRGFVYYGKPYDLDTDVSVDPRGFIVFADGQVDTGSIDFADLNLDNNMPAALSPLVGFDGYYGYPGITVSGGDVEKTDLRYTYRWEAEFAMPARMETASAYSSEMPVMQTSASLYRNDWIVFDYQTQSPFGLIYPGLAGLSPGDGSAGSGHPGEGEERDWHAGAGFIARTLFAGQSPLTFGSPYYTAVHNAAIESEGPLVVADAFFIFRPYGWNETEDGLEYVETPNTYMVSVGTRNILAGGLSSLDEAIGYVADDLDALQHVDTGEFLPDYYEYGLQTVGQDENGAPAFFDTPHPLPWVASGRDLINNDGFIAYAVQVEEDIVNRKILEMHQEAYQAGRIRSLMDNIVTAKGYSQIRERDDWFTRQADAQAGRVLRDQNGNWVRVQQYVLQPDRNTVQVLSASLRDVAGKQELSTLDFTTVFRNGDSVDYSISKLPWYKWLDTRTDTQGDVTLKYVKTTPVAPLLESMTVTIKNPSADSFQEMRTFTERATSFKQYVTGEQLQVNLESYTNQYDLGTPSNSTVGYSIDYTIGGGGFSYNIAGRSDSINVSFYELSGNSAPGSGQTYKDIWDALRVNSGGTAPDIGESSLEIVISDGAATEAFNPFDVVYIPMSRMLWKDNAETPLPDQST